MSRSGTPPTDTGRRSIRRLPAAVIHKIAAGEVVEAPASVVKELCENSLDAKSTVIRISTTDAGLGTIAIEDDGVGIAPQEMELAVTEHATSKIVDVADLDAIRTYGFRGEALASIASISELEVASRPGEATVGRLMRFNAGQKQSEQDLALPKGTRITIHNLFFNTPARRKFLKSGRAENERIRRLILKLSLANPQVHFTYRRDGKQVLDITPSDDVAGRILDIYGHELTEMLIPLQMEATGLSVSGFISTPDLYRSHRREQHFFVDGRPVEIEGTGRVFRRIYEELIPAGMHPVGFFFFKVEPHLVDVNVHPAKKEIRFLDSDRFIGFFQTALRRSLDELRAFQALQAKKKFRRKKATGKFHETGYFKNTDPTEPLFETPAGQSKSAPNVGPGAEPYAAFVDELKEIGAVNRQAHAQAAQAADGADGAVVEAGGANADADGPLTDALSQTVDTGLEHASTASAKAGTPSDEGSRGIRQLQFRRHFGLIFGTYILAEGNGALVLIDQHAAHERIRYEAALRAMAQGGVKVQNLLTPHAENLTPDEMELWTVHQPTLHQAGLETEQITESQIVLTSVPSYTTPGQEAQLLRDALGRMQKLWEKEQASTEETQQAAQNSEVEHELAASIACHSALKAGDVPTSEDISGLLTELGRCAEPRRCPHGRPTIIELDESELERLFRRSV